MLHIFFLHYGISLVVGGAVIAGIFLLGGGLQICSIMVLLNMYNQPAIIMLRRMDVYEVRAELRSGSYSPCEKIDIAIEASFLKPQLDKIFLFNAIFIGLSVVSFFCVNALLLNLSKITSNLWLGYVCAVIVSFALELAELGIVQLLKGKAG